MVPDINLREAYNNYRKSLGKDVLKECEHYAKTTPTKRPDVFPTIFHYLQMLMHDFQKALNASDVSLYSQTLLNHKTAMMKLQEFMVRELAWVLEEDRFFTPEESELTIQIGGWEYFRYAKSKGIQRTFFDTDFIVIPYYGDFCKDVWENNSAVIDVDELLEAGPETPSVFMKKVGTTGFKIVDGHLCGLDHINKGLTIKDWKLIT